MNSLPLYLINICKWSYFKIRANTIDIWVLKISPFANRIGLDNIIWHVVLLVIPFPITIDDEGPKYHQIFICQCYKPITNTAWVRARLCKLQKGCTRLAAASDKVYQLLAHDRWFSLGTPATSTTNNYYIIIIYVNFYLKFIFVLIFVFLY